MPDGYWVFMDIRTFLMYGPETGFIRQMLEKKWPSTKS